MSYLQQIGTYVANAMNDYMRKFNISTTEYKTGYKRGSSDVYGVEQTLSVGLGNTTTITEAITGYTGTYTYWIDLNNSYAHDATNDVTIPLVGDGVSIKIDDANGEIDITTTDDKSSFGVVKLVLNYTK